MFLHGRSTKKIIAVADVGSASVAVALLSVGGGGPAEVLVANRSSLPFEDRTEEASIKGIIAALKEAGEKTSSAQARKDAHMQPVSRCYAVINPPWTRTKTVSSVSVTPHESKITAAIIGEMAQRAITDEKQFDSAKLIESTVVRVELNGYPTSAPTGKSAHRIAVSELLSECAPAIKDCVEAELKHIFPKADIVKRSGARALISSISALPEGSSDYVIIAVMGETTNVIVVRGGLACAHVVIPEGIRSILKRISDKRMQEETLSLLRMVERDECSTDVCDEITKSMGRVEIDLARVYGESLTKIAAPVRLPPDLVLITHDDLRPWLSKFFMRIDFTQCTSTAQPFSVHALSQQDFKNVVSGADTAAIDIELLIACTLVNSEMQNEK